MEMFLKKKKKILWFGKFFFLRKWFGKFLITNRHLFGKLLWFGKFLIIYRHLFGKFLIH